MLKIVIVIFLFLFSLGFLNCGNAVEDIPNLPRGFDIPWDISKDENLLVQDFTVYKEEPASVPSSEIVWNNSPNDKFQSKDIGYFFCIEFKMDMLSHDKKESLRNFIGKGPHAGTPIPVVVKVEKIDGNDIKIFMSSTIIDTEGEYRHNDEHVDRLISMIKLPAGKYRISVSTPHKIKLPIHAKTFLSVFKRGG